MVAFRLNGRDVDVDVPGDEPLLYVLADDLKMNGVKYGCGKSQCGACHVLIDGVSVASCQTSVSAAAGTRVTTLEGLRDPDGSPSLLQQAFIDEQAAQCGFCLNGVILTAKAFLDRNPGASDAEIRQALSGVLCRCFANVRMIRAIGRYARGAAV